MSPLPKRGHSTCGENCSLNWWFAFKPKSAWPDSLKVERVWLFYVQSKLAIPDPVMMPAPVPMMVLTLSLPLFAFLTFPALPLFFFPT
jgi:hypothetical protein